MKSVKSLNRIFSVIEYWFKALDAKFGERIQFYFSGKAKTNLGTLQKLFSYLGVGYKFVLNSVKTHIGIFCAREYWFRALECKIWPTNTQSFFWENGTNLQILEKLSPYIGVSDKFVLKSVKSLNRIFWVIEYWLKFLEAKFDRQIQNYFSRKVRESLELFKSFVPILEFPTNLFWSLPKS